jgi:hypothetical protein
MIKKKKILQPEEMPEFQASVKALPIERKKYIDEMMEIAARTAQQMWYVKTKPATNN